MRDKSHKSAQLPDDVFKRQRVAASTLNVDRLSAWIRNEDVISAGVQLQLLAHPAVSIHEALAAKQDLLPQVFEELQKYNSSRILSPLGSNPEVPAETLELIINKAHFRVLEVIAAKARVLAPSQRELLKDYPEYHVRRAFATRGDLSESETIEIFQREDATIQRIMMAKISLDSPVVQEVIKKQTMPLLGAFTRRGDIPDELLLDMIETIPGLLEDTSGLVSGRRHSLKVIDRIFEGDISRVARNLTLNANLSEKHMLRLLQDLDPEIPRWLAKRPDASPEVLRMIIEGNYTQSVKREVYLNPSAPLDFLRAGLESKNPKVLEKLAQNTNLPDDIKAELVLTKDYRTLNAIVLNSSIQLNLDSPALLWRMRQMRQRFIPAEILELEAGCDADAWAALYPTWAGSIRELVQVCEIFKSEAP